MKGENEKKLFIVPGTSNSTEDFLNGDLLDDSKIFYPTLAALFAQKVSKIEEYLNRKASNKDFGDGNLYLNNKILFYTFHLVFYAVVSPSSFSGEFLTRFLLP